MLDNNQANSPGPAMPTALRVGLGLWMSAVILGTFLYIPPAQGFAYPEAARIVIFHVPCSIAALVAYIVSAIYAAGYLRGGRAISDEKSAISAGLGLLFTVLATATGMVFAKIQWGRPWSWDPRQTSILMLMTLYAAYFMLRTAVPGRTARARISAAYSILAALVMPFLLIVLPRIMTSIHPKDTLISGGGLSPEYWAALVAAVIGYIWLYIWLFRIQVRVAEFVLAARRVRVE